MAKNIHQTENGKVVAFIDINKIEDEALGQIVQTSQMPFLFKHVAVMPDTHYGKGSTVGTVLATKNAIIPAAVGVDIGCGMIAVKTSLTVVTKPDGSLDEKTREQLAKIRGGIERRIPMSAGRFNDKITKSAELRNIEMSMTDGFALAGKLSPNWPEQMGTLGGGNHFIELCVDLTNTLWVTLHSGSRGVGNKIGNHYIGCAQKCCAKNFIQLPNPDLAYLVEGGEEWYAYMLHLRWAQKFAMLNREEMMDRVMAQVAETLCHDYNAARSIEVERINCHHNFTQKETHFGEEVWITRKGAIEATTGKRGMIPGSMGTSSYIVTGKGEPMSFNSAPHGAGRRMSRAKAKAKFNMDDFDKAMVGIEHRRSADLLDELPLAYKDIHEVIDDARDLIQVDTVLKQILNVKGD